MTGIDDAKDCFTGIANAIRSKTGKSASMKITDMATEINSISTATYVNLTVTVGVASATVIASYSGGSDITATTNSSGVATLSVSPGYDYSVTASKTNYISNTATKHVDAGGASMSLSISAYPVVTITLTDANGASVANRVIQGTGASTVSATTNSSGVATFTLSTVGTYNFTVASSSIPTGGSASTYSVTVSANGTYSGAIAITYRFGYTILRVARSTSSPTARCSYPSSVTINGKTYTNSAPAESNCAKGTSLNGWASHKLIEGIKPVLKNGSTWTDLEKSSSASWSTNGDAFTEFPFRWLGFYKDSSYDYILLSDESENPDSTVFNDYAFLNNSNVRQPNTHVGCFDADYTSSVLGSKRGTSVKVSTSLTNFISCASARGTNYDIITYWQAQYITALFCTLYKTTDCQGYSDSLTGLGYGYTASNNSAPRGNSGVSFDNSYGLYGTKSNSTSAVVFFWLHDIWGSVYQWVGGAKTNSSRQLMTCVGKMSSTTDSDFNLTENTSGAYPTSNVSGYMTDMAGTVKSGFFPIASSSGSSTTYFSDAAYVFSSLFPFWGGSWNDAGGAGLFAWVFNVGASDTGSYIGSRLSYKGGRS